MEYNEFGEELPDPTPVSIPVGAGRPESLQESIKRMIRNEMSQYAQSQEMETFEEAQDFDCDEEELVSPYEMSELQEEVPAGELMKLTEAQHGKSPESDRNNEGGQSVSESSDGVDTEAGGDDNGSPRRAHRRASEKDARGRNPRRKAVSSQADVRSPRVSEHAVGADDEEQ